MARSLARAQRSQPKAEGSWGTRGHEDTAIVSGCLREGVHGLSRWDVGSSHCRRPPCARGVPAARADATHRHREPGVVARGVNAGARSGRWARRPSQCPRSWRSPPPSPPPPAWRAPAPQPLRAAAGFFTEFLMLKRPVHPCEFPCDFVFRTGEHLRTFSEWRNHGC